MRCNIDKIKAGRGARLWSFGGYWAAMVVAVFVVETVTFAVSTAFASASAFSRKVIMKKPPPDCSGRRFLSLGNEKRFALFELFLLSFVPVAHRAEVAADAAVDFAGLAAGAHLAASAVVGAEVDPTSVTGAIPSFMSSDFWSSVVLLLVQRRRSTLVTLSELYQAGVSVFS